MEQLGAQGLIELPPQKGKWTRDKGETITRTWIGTAEQIVNKKNQLIAFDYLCEDIQTDLNTTPAKLSATYQGAGSADGGPQNEKADPQWQVYTEEITKELKEHPKFHVHAYADKYIAEIDAWINDGDQNKDMNKGERTYWDSQYPNSNMGTYFGLRMAGVTGYTMFAWTIRKTVAITRLTTVNVTCTENPACVSYADIGVPSDVHLTPPQSWVWLAIPPTIEKQGAKKVITWEWRGGNYSPTLYTGGNKEPWELVA